MDVGSPGVAGVKPCTKCKIVKPLSEYYENKRTKDQKQSCCKVCSSKATRKSKMRNRCADCGDSIDYKATRCIPCSKSREHHPRWKGGRRIEPESGYVLLRLDGKTISEHRHLMEQYIGRPLIKGETVHHKNGVRDDNRMSNLELWSKAQPAGQRVIDKLEYAREIIALYSDYQDPK
jgi:hypothetical protein